MCVNVFGFSCSVGHLPSVPLLVSQCQPTQANGCFLCVVCARLNPSGNGLETTGPIGIVQWCHVQVPVLIFFLTLSLFFLHHCLCLTWTCTDILSCLIVHRQPIYCISLHLKEWLHTLYSTQQPFRINATHACTSSRMWTLFNCFYFTSAAPWQRFFFYMAN